MFIPDPGSDFIPSRIPDPNCLHPGSSKNLIILTPKKAKKWCLSSRKWSGLFIPDPGSGCLSSKKYDQGCSSRIPDPDADFLPSRIPDPGVKKAPNPGSATLQATKKNLTTAGKQRSQEIPPGKEQRSQAERERPSHVKRVRTKNTGQQGIELRSWARTLSAAGTNDEWKPETKKWKKEVFRHKTAGKWQN